MSILVLSFYNGRTDRASLQRVIRVAVTRLTLTMAIPIIIERTQTIGTDYQSRWSACLVASVTMVSSEEVIVGCQGVAYLMMSGRRTISPPSSEVMRTR